MWLCKVVVVVVLWTMWTQQDGGWQYGAVYMYLIHVRRFCIHAGGSTYIYKHVWANRRMYSTVLSNTFDSGVLMLCTGMALYHNTSLHVGGSQIWYIIASCRVVWLTGGQFLIRGCGCTRWCSASSDKQSGIQGAWENHMSSIKKKNVKVAR